MLLLPPAQLRDLLDKAANLREPLLEHVQSFTESQRAHGPANIMDVLYNADVKPTAEELAAIDAETPPPANAEPVPVVAPPEEPEGAPGEPAPPGC